MRGMGAWFRAGLSCQSTGANGIRRRLLSPFHQGYAAYCMSLPYGNLCGRHLYMLGERATSFKFERVFAAQRQPPQQSCQTAGSERQREERIWPNSPANCCGQIGTET